CLPSRKDDDYAAIDERTSQQSKKFPGEQNGSRVMVQRQRTDCRFHGARTNGWKDSRPVVCSAKATSLFSLRRLQPVQRDCPEGGLLDEQLVYCGRRGVGGQRGFPVSLRCQ